MSKKGGSYIVDADGNEVLQECTDVKVTKAPEKDAKDQSQKSADAAQK